jgi:3-methylfumaryl-CoA hydratase
MDKPSAELSAWTGRSETLHDTITEAPIRALDATLDHPPRPSAGHAAAAAVALAVLPAAAPPSEIGPDGHARRGGFLPPVPLPRRMWAGSQFEFRAPARGRRGDAHVDDRRRHAKRAAAARWSS